MANRKLNSIKFPDIADTYILDADKVNFDDSETYASGSVGKALQNKANIDGSYSDLTAGNAEQLVSNVKVNDKTPYLFRTSGGSVDIGDREYVNGIVGGTVAFNQLVQNGNFADTTKWSKASGTLAVANNVGTFTANASAQFHGIYQNVSVKSGHKYFVNCDFKVTTESSSVTRIGVVFSNGANGDITLVAKGSGWQNASYIKPMTSDWSQMYIITEYGLPIAVGDTIEYKNVQVIDLTQMFGSTIADYIYSLEQATAGAGVAWFKKLFPNDYYAYNAGEIKSVEGLSEHKTTGANLLTRTTGSNIYNAGNLIPVKSGEKIYAYGEWTYTSSATMYARVFKSASSTAKTDAGTAPSNNYFNSATVMSFTMPCDGYFGICYSAGVATYTVSKFMASRKPITSEADYEPYTPHDYILDNSLTLRGIPKLDANNNLYYDGDTYESDGTVTRKYGIVDLGTLTWSFIADYNGFMTDLSGGTSPMTYGNPNIICPKYPTVVDSFVNIRQMDKVLFYANETFSSASGKMVIIDSAYTSASDFKTAMSGVYLVYELATPTTEIADAYVGTQIVNDFGTEEYVIDSDTFAVPVGHDTDYPVNLVAKLEMAPNSPEGNGDYIVRQVNGENTYVPLVIEDALPTIPSTAGSYKLTVTVAEGSDPVLSWTAE